MARLDYPDLASAAPEVQQLADQIRAARGGRLLNLYKMQLYNPPITRGWLQLGSAVRFESELASRDRELAICCVARLTGADYEWRVHRRLALEAGLTDAQLDALPRWRETDAFDARQRAILALAEQSTTAIEVDDATFQAARQHLPPRQLVELIATVAYYNMVARFLVALAIDPEAA